MQCIHSVLTLANGVVIVTPVLSGRPAEWAEEAISERSPHYRLPRSSDPDTTTVPLAPRKETHR